MGDDMARTHEYATKAKLIKLGFTIPVPFGEWAGPEMRKRYGSAPIRFGEQRNRRSYLSAPRAIQLTYFGWELDHTRYYVLADLESRNRDSEPVRWDNSNDEGLEGFIEMPHLRVFSYADTTWYLDELFASDGSRAGVDRAWADAMVKKRASADHDRRVAAETNAYMVRLDREARERDAASCWRCGNLTCTCDHSM